MSENDPTSNRDLTRRDLVIAAGVVTIASAASSQVPYGVIGTGAQGTYLQHHMAGLQNCRCVALCDTDEPRRPVVARGAGCVEPPVIGGATLGSMGNGRKGFPLLLEKDQFHDGESFLRRELKFARRWLYSKGAALPEEDRNPVEVQMESFFDCCRTGDSPNADVDAGLARSTAVILSNLAMDEERRVYFNEIEKMGLKP